MPKFLCQLRGFFFLGLLFTGVLMGKSIAQPATRKTNPNGCPEIKLPYPRPEPNYLGKQPRKLAPFALALKNFAPMAASVEQLVAGKTIPQLQQLMKQGKLSSEKLLLHYLNRIQRYDIDKLNSVLELNPDALMLARSKDAERKRSKSLPSWGLMQGIPVLIKDNIATADKMHTTAGAAALLAWKPSHDAFLVAQLRKSGAILLGKANLSEWANYMDPCMPSGFSTNGGQTRNPYGPFDTWGSSSGSAVSVAADLITVSVGSETQGSIIMPAGINSVVGLKTSMGLISRSMVLPLLGFQDVPGPMGRNVTDVAVLLSAMTGTDANDPATLPAAPLVNTNFTKFLNPSYAKTLKIGLPIYPTESIDNSIKALEGKTDSTSVKTRALLYGFLETAKEEKNRLINAGFTVVPIPSSDLPKSFDLYKILSFGFREDLNQFFAKLGKEAPYQNLAGIIEYNSQDLKNRAPYGQKYLEMAQASTLTQAQFDSTRNSHITKAKAAIDQLLKKYGVDLIAGSLAQTYAPAGYPALTIPVGYDDEGSPKSLILVGTYLSEPKLLAAGYQLEQFLKARKNPDLEKTLKTIPKQKP